MKRVFVDFARISKRTKVTGIPRVTYEYFTRFLDLSLRRDGDWIVYPVNIEGAGMVRNCLHNLPAGIISRYLEYLEKLDVLHPEQQIGDLAGTLKMQVQGRLPKDKSAAAPTSLRRRLAQWRRGLLARIASVDPVLRNMLKFHVTGRNLLDSPELAFADQFKLVGNHVFHQHGDGDVCFMPGYWHDMTPMSYFTLQQSGVMIVPMVHDLLPVIIPEKYNPTWSRHFHFNVYVTCLLADAIVSISDSTRMDLERLLESHSYPPPEIFVHHHGFDFRRNPGLVNSSSRFSADERYFLMVGTIEPKKNHSLVIDQFLGMAESHPGIRLKIVGCKGWMHDEITAKISLVIKRGHPVDYYKDVDDTELATAYGNALATIMASSHEGFGLPVIESLSLGCPVILPDIPVFREVAGGHGTYFLLENPATLGQAMRRRVDANAPRQMENFSWPAWDEQAAVLFDWLVTRTSRNRAVPGARSMLSV